MVADDFFSCSISYFVTGYPLRVLKPSGAESPILNYGAYLVPK
jgi:hypothetical protein